jgi:hypothetical protein
VWFPPAVAAMDLQQLPLSDQVTDRHRLETERLPLAPASGLVPTRSNSTTSGRQAISFEMRRAWSLVSLVLRTATSG